MPPVTFSPTVVALMQSPTTIQLQQADLFSRPLDGLEVGQHYSLAEALPFLPAGPLKNAALRFANVSDISFSYKLADANGGSPRFSFLQEPQAGIPYKNGTFLSSGGDGGDPVSSNSFETNVGGVLIIVGADTAMSKAGMPQPLIAPVLGSSYAMADGISTYFLKTNPSEPLTASIRGNLASFGVATATNGFWSFGLDAVGVKEGTGANAWGSSGLTLLTFAPAIESSMNPVYWPAYANAFRSAIGVGLQGGVEGSSVFLAEGGAAGGAGVGGATFQTVGVVGAVLMGGNLGGWATEHATEMDNENSATGKLAKLTYSRYLSEAYEWTGNKWYFGKPLRSISAGIISGLEMKKDAEDSLGIPKSMRGVVGPCSLSGALKQAEDNIVAESKSWAGAQMDAVLIQALMVNSNIQEHPETKTGDIKIDPMDFEGFKKTIKQFYRTNSDAIYAQDKVLQVLRQNGLISDDELGITRFIDNNGDITNEKGLKAYAADLLENHLKLRNEQVERMAKDCGLVVGSDGKFESKYGGAFTQEQLDYMHNTMPTLGGGILRITNALATLRPEDVAVN